MGWGDDLITTSVVKRAYAKVGQRLCVGDGSQAFWSAVFENNPKIAQKPYEGCQWVRTYKGYRPYIKSNEPEHIVYEKDFKAEPGEIFFSQHELDLFPSFDNFILIEPNTKRLPLSRNKDWGPVRWQAVVKALPQFRWVQMKTGKHKLDGVELVGTTSIRQGFAMLRRAAVFLGTDGALHHAAAALGMSAVVVWGGLASPKNLGYDSHVNLHGGSNPCGWKAPCLHCQGELDKITVPMVIEAIKAEYERVANSATTGPRPGQCLGAIAPIGQETQPESPGTLQAL